MKVKKSTLPLVTVSVGAAPPAHTVPDIHVIGWLTPLPVTARVNEAALPLAGTFAVVREPVVVLLRVKCDPSERSTTMVPLGVMAVLVSLYPRKLFTPAVKVFEEPS